MPNTKPLTAKDAKTAITTVITVPRIVLVAFRFRCLETVRRLRSDGDAEKKAEFGVAGVEVGSRARPPASGILT